MKFELPFGEELIVNMGGKTMVLSENFLNSPVFRSFWTVDVKSGGDIDRGYFEVVDGVLRLVDKSGLFGEFNCIEARNGVVYVVGMPALKVSKEGLDRLTMHEKVSLGKDEFGICISSHVNYAKNTLPLLLDSLNKAKFDMSKVIVIVGGFVGEKEETIEGARVLYTSTNGKGFGGLSGTDDRYKYWLLLHDTCEAERSFVRDFVDVDIGLNPDVVRLRSDNDDWTGFYSTEFIKKIKDEITNSNKDIVGLINKQAKVVTVIPGIVKTSGEKDVYGTGNKRVIDALPVGVRKFRGTSRRKTP
jgi:hypothetical protein